MANLPTSDSLQYLKNNSADQSVNPAIPREGIMGKGVDGAWYNIGVNVDGSIGSNSSLSLSYTGDVLTSLTKTIGSAQYVKTLTYTDGVLTGVSAWSLVT